MPKRKEEVYSTLFDYIFSTKKPKGGVEIEGANISGLTGVGKGLAEMAAYPAVYPAEKLIDDFNFQADLATRVKVEPTGGFKIEVGPFSLARFVSNPRGAIDSAWKKYQQEKSVAKWTGNLKYLESAYFATFAKSAGLSAGFSLAMGSAIHDVTGYGPSFFGKQHPIESATLGPINRGWSRDTSIHWDKISGDVAGRGNEPRAGSVTAWSTGLNSEFQAALKKYQRDNAVTLTPNEIKDARSQFMAAIKNSSIFTDKSQRRGELYSKLSLIQPRNGILFSRRSIVDGVWGDVRDPDDLGYHTEVGKDPDTTARIRYASAQSVLKQLDEEIKQMRLSGRFSATQINRAVSLKDIFERKIRGEDVGFLGSLGGRIGQFMYTSNWINDEVLKGKILGSFMMGSIFDFKSDIWSSGGLDRFAQGYKKEIGGQVVDVPNGWFVGSGNTLGRMAEAYYYWHPVNIVKGIFWDGRFWKKIGDIRGRRGLSTGAMKFLAEKAPSQLLSKWKKIFLQSQVDKYGPKIANWLKGPLAAFAKRFVDDFNGLSIDQILKMPLKQLVTQIVQKILVQVLGSVIPGIGAVAAFVADWVIKIGGDMAEKVLKPLLEFLVLIVLGFFSLVLLGITGLGLWGKQTLTQPYLSEPVEYTSGHLVYGPIDFNFPDTTDGDVNCNQTLPEQHVSGVASKSVVADLADRWTTGTNFADECYNDVICRAQSKGVDPAFALLIWLNESGASNYDSSTLPVQDFGINDNSIAENFSAQIDAFLALSHSAACPGLDYWTSWATKYLTGSCDTTKVVNGITGPEYLDGIRDRYSWVKPGGTLPSQIKNSSNATGQLCVGVGGSIYSNYTGSGMPFGGGVLTGTPLEIWNKALAELGVSANFVLVYPGSFWYDSAIGPGAWCFSDNATDTVYCKANEINGASDSTLSGLFRHELAHQVQHSNGSLSNWPNYIHREWGAEHLSGNGGHYKFSTSDGYCMDGLQVSKQLLDSGSCTASQLGEIARGKALSGTACAAKVKSYIVRAKIGRDC